MNIKLIRFLIIGLVMVSCGPQLPDDVSEAYDKLPQALDFNVHVKPILSDKCFLCHGPDKAKQQADLQLDVAEKAYAELVNNPGKHAIVPGKPSSSEAVQRILSHDPKYIMPTPESNLVLTPYEKAVLVKWIEDGAEYKPHWAFIKPQEVTPPEVNEKEKVNNPIDNFVLKMLETKGLSPAEEASKEMLLRRLTFDLTGLPPTPEEIASFVQDTSPDAYEKQVDRLLTSPHYGERMAVDWMDLARFADTHGYSIDAYRDMSPWRDWVIKAFNENMPYDQFVTWQLAGDLLPNPTKEQMLATGFNRLHQQNMEGGIIDEEFRVEYVVDRVNTVGQAFMGLTVACAKCHDHKYDPISQKSYFEMYSFFNNVNEAGQISFDHAMPVPTILWTTDEQDEILAFLKNEVADKSSKLDRIAREADTGYSTWLASGAYKDLLRQKYPKGIQAHFTFENNQLVNSLNPRQKGVMKQVSSPNEIPEFGPGKRGKGLLLNGDAWMDCGEVGVFRRSDPFSVSIAVNIPADLTDGNIFHKGDGAALYNFRGFHLALRKNRLELLMAHTKPDNAIIEYASDIPRDKWVMLTVTYDGSSTAAGYRLYVDGVEVATEVAVDNLYKDIHFPHRGKNKQPGLSIGARWRGIGIGGATVDDLMVFGRELTAPEVLKLYSNEALREKIKDPIEKWTSDDKQAWKRYYLHHDHKPYKQELNVVRKARMALADSVDKVQEVMVMKEMPEPRQAYILQRGLYNAYGEEVFPNTPESIMPMPEDLPRNRLGLAQWLMHPDHPLTARVTVNRYWQHYFGRGLVKTTEDFGNQGELPSHPQLLDWLALRFMKSGWDVKALQKLIVMSATYRQDSFTDKNLREVDGENMWLARGPATRLTGEMLRDNALMASGLLKDTIGGKSVKPYQPEGLWKINSKNYTPDTGDKLYRRSLYTIWKRSVPHPTLASFDAPERSECTVRRQKTNTPLQALVLLNDPTYIEAAKVLGEQMTKEQNVKNAVESAFVKLTGRKPQQDELSILLELREQQLMKFDKDITKAKGWLSTGEYQVDSTLHLSELAANAVVASTIMNADATITKR